MAGPIAYASFAAREVEGDGGVDARDQLYGRVLGLDRGLRFRPSRYANSEAARCFRIDPEIQAFTVA